MVWFQLWTAHDRRCGRVVRTVMRKVMTSSVTATTTTMMMAKTMKVMAQRADTRRSMTQGARDLLLRYARNIEVSPLGVSPTKTKLMISKRLGPS
jgi:hypothetical protein